MDSHIYTAYSLNLVGQNAVKSSTSVAIFFAFIPNQYHLFSQTIKNILTSRLKKNIIFFIKSIIEYKMVIASRFC